jgi:hypothetical protein
VKNGQRRREERHRRVYRQGEAAHERAGESAEVQERAGNRESTGTTERAVSRERAGATERTAQAERP